MNEALVRLMAVPFLVVILFFGATAAVAYQARQRGYSFWLWFVAQLIVINPLIFLVMLALMPNRKRQKLRLQIRAELDSKLAQFGGAPLAPVPAMRSVSMTATTQPPERSVGDLPTIVPRDRSIGDEETRGR